PSVESSALRCTPRNNPYSTLLATMSPFDPWIRFLASGEDSTRHFLSRGTIVELFAPLLDVRLLDGRQDRLSKRRLREDLQRGYSTVTLEDDKAGPVLRRWHYKQALHRT